MLTQVGTGGPGLPGVSGAHGLALQPDGKLVAAGSASDGTIFLKFGIARYDGDAPGTAGGGGEAAPLSLLVGCAAGETECVGTVTLATTDTASAAAGAAVSARRRRARPVVLGKASFRVPGGRRARVRVRLSREGRRLVSRSRRLRVTATIRVRDASGNARTTRFTLRRR